MCSTATVAEARRDAAVLTKPQAAAAVRGVLRANAASCRVRVVRVTGTGSARSWRVAALTSGAAAGSSLWSVVRQPRPLNALARRISRGCPQPPPPSPPPPTSPRPPAPGAPATYSFGAELSGAQALVRRGLDAGARYYRSALGRELPSFGIWAPRQSGRDRGRVCADEADLARGCAPALGRRLGWSRDPEKGLARSWLVRRAGGNRAQDRCARDIPPSPVRARGRAPARRLDARRDPTGRAVVAGRGLGRILRVPCRRRGRCVESRPPCARAGFR